MLLDFSTVDGAILLGVIILVALGFFSMRNRKKIRF